MTARGVEGKGEIKNEGDEEAVKGVDFGDGSLRPPGGAERKDRADRGCGQPAAAQLACDQEQHADRGCASQGRKQIDPVGQVLEREVAEGPAQNRVQRIAGGMGDAQARQDDLELQAIVEDRGHGWRKRGHVQRQCGQAQAKRPPAVAVNRERGAGYAIA